VKIAVKIVKLVILVKITALLAKKILFFLTDNAMNLVL
jgi:hypothetical protein